MITVAINGIDVLEKRIEKMALKIQSGLSLSKISREVQNDLTQEVIDRGWINERNVVKRRLISKTLHEVYIGGATKYKDIAVWLHRGTPPHIIRPKNKKFLMWFSDFMGAGLQHFAKKVRHPGTKATDWFSTATLIRRGTMTKIGKIIQEDLSAN